MKTVEITQVGSVCRHCGKAMRVGQMSLLVDLPSSHPITDRKLHHHVRCLAKLVEAAPPDKDEQSFHELRQRIAVSNNPYCD